MMYTLRRVATAACASALLASCSDSPFPTQVAYGPPAMLVRADAVADGDPCPGYESVLLIQENVPWGAGNDQDPSGANTTELMAQGIAYCLIRSADLESVDLASFSTVVISAAQTQAFYDRLFPGGGVHTAISAFVEQGGVLVANLTDVASGPGSGGSWAGDAFVAGVRRVTRYHNNNGIDAASHPIIAGPAECPSGNCAQIQDVTLRQDLDNWFHSSHGYFVNLPAEVTVLLTQPDVTGDGLPEPVMVEYAAGSGRVIASMVTAEQRYSSNKIRSLKLLANELAYGISISTPVEASPLSAGERIAALSADLEMLVEAGALDAGNANSLRRKLMAAAKSLEAGRPRTAANQIRAFRLEVKALMRSGRLSSEQGERLLEGASALLDALNTN